RSPTRCYSRPTRSPAIRARHPFPPHQGTRLVRTTAQNQEAALNPMGARVPIHPRVGGDGEPPTTPLGAFRLTHLLSVPVPVKVGVRRRQGLSRTQRDRNGDFLPGSGDERVDVAEDLRCV